MSRKRKDVTPEPEDPTNHRNGTGGKTVLSDDGPLTIEVPRDREATVEPRVIAKHERRISDPTNALESVHAQGRKIIKTRGPTHWKPAINHCATLDEDRLTPPRV